MKLTFNAKQVRDLINMTLVANPGVVPYTGPSYEELLGPKHREIRERGLQLVGDHGIYLMSNADWPQAKRKDGTAHIVYAEECNPDTNPDWHCVKRMSFGGDDGVEFFTMYPYDGKPSPIVVWATQNPRAKKLYLDVSQDSITLL
jgi:hypothetical protein